MSGTSQTRVVYVVPGQEEPTPGNIQCIVVPGSLPLTAATELYDGMHEAPGRVLVTWPMLDYDFSVVLAAPDGVRVVHYSREEVAQRQLQELQRGQHHEGGLILSRFHAWKA